MIAKTCNTCWFAGMDLKTSNPHGPLVPVCMIHGRRIRGGCSAWEEDREDMGCPTPRDISTAKAVYKARKKAA